MDSPPKLSPVAPVERLAPPGDGRVQQFVNCLANRVAKVPRFIALPLVALIATAGLLFLGWRFTESTFQHTVWGLIVLIWFHLFDRIINKAHEAGDRETIRSEYKSLIEEQAISTRNLVTKQAEERKKQLDDLTEITQTTKRVIDTGAGSAEAMHKAAVMRFFANRSDGYIDIIDEIRRPESTSINIIGLTLYELIIRDSGQLKSHLTKIIVEEKRDIHIRILIADPLSRGALLRSKSEKSELTKDGFHAVAEWILRKVNEIKSKHQLNFSVETRVYRSAPMMFLIMTPSVCYIQQYYYWEKWRSSMPVPLVKFSKTPKAATEAEVTVYEDAKAHFNWVWDKSSVSLEEYVEGACTSMDESLASTRCSGVYNKLEKVSKRIAALINTSSSRLICIQGITLHTIFDKDDGILFETLEEALRRPNVNIRILLLDPICPEAFSRSRIEEEMKSKQSSNLADRENWEKVGHFDSTLFTDSKMSQKVMRDLFSITFGKESTLEIKLYSSRPELFYVRVDEIALVQYYHTADNIFNNRSRHHGKELPVFEFHSEAGADNFQKLVSPARSESLPFDIYLKQFEILYKKAKLWDRQLTERPKRK